LELELLIKGSWKIRTTLFFVGFICDASVPFEPMSIDPSGPPAESRCPTACGNREPAAIDLLDGIFPLLFSISGSNPQQPPKKNPLKSIDI
jgi:hypothetical protein